MREIWKKRCPRYDTYEIKLEQGYDSAENKDVDIMDILGWLLGGAEGIYGQQCIDSLRLFLHYTFLREKFKCILLLH